jgi:hypothetical protein
MLVDPSKTIPLPDVLLQQVQFVVILMTSDSKLIIPTDFKILSVYYYKMSKAIT